MRDRLESFLIIMTHLTNSSKNVGAFGRRDAHIALNLALSKAGIGAEAIDAVFAGDLINQCTSSNYGLLDINAPFFGLYGACSTSAEGLISATLYLNATAAKTVAVATSSHNCSAERQFRFPIEYGGVRTPTSQWTVTGAEPLFSVMVRGHI